MVESTTEPTKTADVQAAAAEPSTDAASTTTAATEETTKPTTAPVEAAEEEFVYPGDLGAISSTFERNPQVETKPVPLFAYGNRVRIAALHQNYEPYLDKLISVAGWARSTRAGGETLFFIELNDGSCQSSIQIVMSGDIPNFAEIATTKVGCSVSATGKLIRSPKQGQAFELQVCSKDVHKIKLVGYAQPDKYPLPAKRLTKEYLRTQAHLRCRTKLISAVMRVRNNLAYATHKFFQERGFQYVHTPIITASDCEGAGEMLQVSTLLPAADKPVSSMKLIERVGEENEEEKKGEDKPLSKKKQKKLANKNKQKGGPPAEGTAPATEGEAESATPAEETPAVEEEKKVEEAPLIPLEDRKLNYRADFFKKPAFLTVSGQINVETYACGMGDVYTFGPTFRAEKSDTSRHLAEFWMIEPELCFAELPDVMDCAEDYVKYCLRYIMENNKDDVEFFNQWVDKGLKERLQNVIETPFTRISYTEAIETLIEHLKTKKVKKFVNKPYWGIDMGSEHERYLAEKVYNGPISVYDFPKDFKAFYMKANDDGKTVQAFDMLVPGIGELIGGSAREEDLGKLDAMIAEKNLDIEAYWWYRELRMYGTQPHGGFGLGFERLVMMATGVENIRDVIPFPREWNKAEF